MKISRTVSASRSSTTRSATCVAPLAAIGKYRIGLPSRTRITQIIYVGAVAATEVHRLRGRAGRDHVAQRSCRNRNGLSNPFPSN